METILTYRFRIKDSNKLKLLRKMSSDVNFVWNFSNNIVKTKWKESRKYTNNFRDLAPLLKGSSEFLSVNQQTVQSISAEVVLRTQQFKKNVRFRTRKRNLGWIPFCGQTFKFNDSDMSFVYNKTKFRIWQDRKLPKGAVIKSGSISENSQGKWFVNIVIKFDSYLEPSPEKTSVGIDLGLKTLATLSDGKKYENPRITGSYAKELAVAQRAGKKKRVRKIHSVIKNSRMDYQHKFSSEISKTYQFIYVGDVSSKKLIKTKMAKSVNDSSWFQLKTFLSYKTIMRQGKVEVINESCSTVTCSSCNKKTGPSGLSQLNVREWTCQSCSSIHDRDINAAKNILRRGHSSLIKGNPAR